MDNIAQAQGTRISVTATTPERKLEFSCNTGLLRYIKHVFVSSRNYFYNHSIWVMIKISASYFDVELLLCLNYMSKAEMQMAESAWRSDQRCVLHLGSSQTAWINRNKAKKDNRKKSTWRQKVLVLRPSDMVIMMQTSQTYYDIRGRWLSFCLSCYG